MEHCSGDFLSWSEQFGSTTATGFDNEPLKHISNIVITIMFLLVAFGGFAFEALASVLKLICEVFLVTSGSHALHGGPCPFRLVLRW